MLVVAIVAFIAGYFIIDTIVKNSQSADIRALERKIKAKDEKRFSRFNITNNPNDLQLTKIGELETFYKISLKNNPNVYLYFFTWGTHQYQIKDPEFDYHFDIQFTAKHKNNHFIVEDFIVDYRNVDTGNYTNILGEFYCNLAGSKLIYETGINLLANLIAFQKVVGTKSYDYITLEISDSEFETLSANYHEIVNKYKEKLRNSIGVKGAEPVIITNGLETEKLQEEMVVQQQTEENKIILKEKFEKIINDSKNKQFSFKENLQKKFPNLEEYKQANELIGQINTILEKIFEANHVAQPVNRGTYTGTYEELILDLQTNNLPNWSENEIGLLSEVLVYFFELIQEFYFPDLDLKDLDNFALITVKSGHILFDEYYKS